MKRFGLLGLLLIAVLLTGCLTPSLRVAITPSVFELKFTDKELKDIQVEFSKSGWGSLYVKEVVVLVENPEEEVVHQQIKDVDKTVPMFPFGSFTQKIESIDITRILDENILEEDVYNEYLMGKEYKLVIKVEGTKPTSASAKILFK